MRIAHVNAGETGPEAEPRGPMRVALLGNPNTGKTTLFNRLTGLRHKTANFPGTTQEARIGVAPGVRAGGGAGAGEGAPELAVVDLPGVYSLELHQSEAEVCRRALAGEVALGAHGAGAPDAVCVVADATNLVRGLMLVGQTLRRRLPMVVALTMVDLARRQGIAVDAQALEAELGCAVVLCNARSGEGVPALRAALASPRLPVRTVPGGASAGSAPVDAALAAWAEQIAARAVSAPSTVSVDSLTDRADRLVTHPVLGVVVFALVMAGLFWSLFSLAQHPMAWIEWLFAVVGGGIESALPEGIVRDFLAGGVVAGIGGVLVFLPQICLLFFLISLLEDTGYLARAAFVMDRALRPLGLPGHAFVPLLSSHACALPGIIAARSIPDRRERLATILVAPFMTCSARLPVYVLVTGLLFPDSPLKAALAFVGAYALGIAAGGLSALLARRTILRGGSRPMALELPTYKRPSLRTALITTYDRAIVFVKKAGTAILAISIVLWWLGSFPRVEPPAEAQRLSAQAALIAPEQPEEARTLEAQAQALAMVHASSQSFIGRLGRAAQPVFAPLGYDWQLTVGVLASFAAREVFVSTMAVVVTGSQDAEDLGVRERLGAAVRSDGKTPVFTPAVCWSVLVFYVLAMQCLPTLAVTAREAGSVKWALLQLAWMSGVAYLAAWAAYRVALVATGSAA